MEAPFDPAAKEWHLTSSSAYRPLEPGQVGFTKAFLGLCFVRLCASTFSRSSHFRGSVAGGTRGNSLDASCPTKSMIPLTPPGCVLMKFSMS